MGALTGKVQTVLGPIAVEALGVTLPHDHLLVVNPSFIEPDSASERDRAFSPVTIENLGWIRQYWTSNLDNLRLTDEDTAVAEALRYRRAGGDAIVDPTTFGIGRDPAALARISRATGLHIVMGCGYYVSGTQPADMDTRSESNLIREIVDDITVGPASSGVRAGLIGEIGCSWPIHPNEGKVLRAAAAAQQETGAAIMVHPGRHREAPGKILATLAEAKADLTRVILAHLDRTVPDVTGLRVLADRGCYLEFDLFGLETSYYPFRTPGIVTLSDAQRLDLVAALLEKGLGQQILISQDVCTKHRLARYGGHGYDHILANVTPWMRSLGFAEKDIRTILVDNPGRIFQLV